MKLLDPGIEVTDKRERPPLFKIRNHPKGSEAQACVYELLFKRLGLYWGVMNVQHGDTFSPHGQSNQDGFIYHVGGGQLTPDASFAPVGEIPEVLPFRILVKTEYAKGLINCGITEPFGENAFYHQSLFTAELNRLSETLSALKRCPMGKELKASIEILIEKEFCNDIGFMGVKVE